MAELPDRIGGPKPCCQESGLVHAPWCKEVPQRRAEFDPHAIIHKLAEAKWECPIYHSTNVEPACTHTTPHCPSCLCSGTGRIVPFASLRGVAGRANAESAAVTPAKTQARAIYQATHVLVALQAKQRQLHALDPGGLFGWSPAATEQRHRLREDIAALERRLGELKRIAEGSEL